MFSAGFKVYGQLTSKLKVLCVNNLCKDIFCGLGLIPGFSDWERDWMCYGRLDAL